MKGFLQSPWGKYVIALLAVAAALAIRGAMDPWIGRGSATVTLYGAIALAVWFGGFKPGLLAAVIGYLGVNYFFIEPRGTLSLSNTPDFIRFGGFLLSTLLIIALGGAMHSARRRAESDAAMARQRALDLQNEVEQHRRTQGDLEAKERDLQIVTDTMAASVARCSADLR